jgi:uncharacterized C2H2 Zn-finger protein
MKKLRPIKNDYGEVAVKCPRCDEIITPVKNPIGLDGYDCPECNQVIEAKALSLWRKALKSAGESDE